MDYTELRKLSLKGFIGFLGLTAVIAIVFVLFDTFGTFQWKVLATSLTISMASICSMSCAAFIERRQRTNLGLTGIAVSILGGALLIIGMWPEIDSEVYWKTTIACIVVAIGLAHAFLLLLPELDAQHAWVQRASSTLIAILALQIVAAVWVEIESEVYYRFLATVAILVGLVTLVIPILMKLRKGDDGEDDPVRRKPLKLTHVEGDRYRDEAGAEYVVRPVDSEDTVALDAAADADRP